MVENSYNHILIWKYLCFERMKLWWIINRGKGIEEATCPILCESYATSNWLIHRSLF